LRYDKLHFWIDPNYTNYAIYQSLGASKKIEKQSPIQMLKAVKNPVEIQGVKNAHIRDAAAKVSALS
jgi:Xaa-Pro aminopeptidase